jgi:hypothetical protein
MKQPVVKTRKNVLGRDVKITKVGNKKTREVTGNYVSKTRTSVDTKGGKKITKSRIEVDPAMGFGSVRNVTKYTGLAGLKRAFSSKPSSVRKTVYDMKSEVDPKRAKQSGNKMSVRELAQTKYKGGNLPRRFKD